MAKRTPKWNKELRNTIFSKLCWIGVLVIACYIVLGTSINYHINANTISSYEKTIENFSQEDIEAALKKAYAYNDLLYQTMGISVSELSSELYNEAYYESLLNITGTSIMGRIEIPKIAVDLPIYHGTGDDALSNGAGHLQGSSLPVGGNNTRAVLSAHRGLPNAKLFTRLDELKEGDFVFIDVLNKKLAYRVIEITVVDPNDASILQIIPEQDLLSLVTCTPYGINTQRLIVTCARVEYNELEKNSIQKALPSVREAIISYILPALIFLISVYQVFQYSKKAKTRRERRK